MSTHMPGVQSFFIFFASFCIGKISHKQHKGKRCLYLALEHRKSYQRRKGYLNSSISKFQFQANI